MWRPSEVVPEHRGTATLVWIGLIVAIIGYTAWQIVTVVEKYSNPSTSFTMSNDLYDFPVVTVCMEHGVGCGFSDNSTETCIQSAMENSAASFLDENVNAIPSDQDNCIKFDMTKFNVGKGKKTERTSATLKMDWISSNNSTLEMDYVTSVSVSVILGETDGLTEDMMVPYSRNVYSASRPGSATYQLTELTIGKTDRNLLMEPTVETYPVKTTSTLTTVTSKASGLQSQLVEYLRSSSKSTWSADSYFYSDIEFADQVSVGSLFITLTQGSYSYTIIKDINPLELATIIGNIGGFWELLVLAWGIFFISSNQGDAPTLKARNWSVQTKTPEETAGQVPNPSRQASPNTEVAEEGSKERPAWHNIEGISVSMDEEEGRHFKRDQSTNASATLQYEDEDRGTEYLKGKRILKRMVSWGGTGTADDALIRSGHHESDADRKAKTSFFSPKGLFSTSLKRSFRRQKSGASVAAGTEEDEAFRYDPYSNYEHSTREGDPYSSYRHSAGDGGGSHHGASASDLDISEMSGRYDASTLDSSSTVAV